MLKNKLLKMSALFFAVSLAAVGCSTGGSSAEKKELTLAYVAWDTEIASTHVVEYVLENKLGYDVEMLQVDAGPMWAGIADGSADAMVAAWLPGTHASYYEENQGKFEDLGTNLEGTKIGLVVPTYMDIHSIEDLKNADIGGALEHTITGIEPGAGIMMATEKAIEAYGLSDWELLSSSSAAMAAELQTAYDNQEPIVVTGWSPHWKFSKMELKYLEDPQGVYGEAENINTIVRNGLKEDHPDAYKLLDQFHWTEDDINSVMLAILEGADPADAAADWVNANEDKVNAWLEGIE